MHCLHARKPNDVSEGKCLNSRQDSPYLGAKADVRFSIKSHPDTRIIDEETEIHSYREKCKITLQRTRFCGLSFEKEEVKWSLIFLQFILHMEARVIFLSHKIDRVNSTGQKTLYSVRIISSFYRLPQNAIYALVASPASSMSCDCHPASPRAGRAGVLAPPSPRL